MKKTYAGQGNVMLIAGGGKIYTDLAARFVRSEKPIEEIVATPYSRELVKRIVDSGHKSAVEFDYFLFGIEGYSRVTEVQLVRKRLASYLIKSGRLEHKGKRVFNMVVPKSIEGFKAQVSTAVDLISLADGTPLANVLPDGVNEVFLSIDSDSIMSMIELWYQKGINEGVPEEDLRYLKPMATEFKAIVGMNAHALMDWFTIRCCKNAQMEIRDLANKMLRICKDVAPDLFENAGPNCKVLGYCPENELQHNECKGKIYTKYEALSILKNAAHK